MNIEITNTWNDRYPDDLSPYLKQSIKTFDGMLLSIGIKFTNNGIISWLSTYTEHIRNAVYVCLEGMVWSSSC